MGGKQLVLLSSTVTLLIISTLIIESDGQSYPIVPTSEGPVLGRLAYSRNGRPYFEYLGIPYSDVPGRYEPSTLPKQPRSKKLFKALQTGPNCIQYDILSRQVKGQEDCLYLNIYTPKGPLDGKEGLLPVMVFLHSGAFMFSNPDAYRGKYFADHDVLLVTLNFRLGSFGFLNTQDGLTEGNLGLKDQATALRWLQKNIDSFGGDPKVVTLWGDSSGAMSVHLHTLSPMSTGLFSRAISSSGNALCPHAFVRDPRAMAIRLGEMMGCPTGEIEKMLDCLKSKPAEEIAAKHAEFIEYRIDPISPFAPSIEANHDGEIFLSTPPYTLLRESQIANKVPWMVGINSEECMLDAGFVLTNETLLDQMNEDWEEIAPLTFYFREDTLDPAGNANLLRQYYFENKPIDMNTRDNLTNIYSDRYFGHCTRVGAFLHATASNGTGAVYPFHFSFVSNSSIANILGIEHYGVNMGDEVQYFFNTDYYPEIVEGSEYAEFSENLIRLWVSFARTGRPDLTWGEAKLWPRINPELTIKDLQFYQIDKETKIVEQPGLERMEFWDKVQPFDI